MSQHGATRTDVSLPSRYRVQRVLGSGGMATVYLADDEVSGRAVAVKVLRPELAGAVMTDRFLREIAVVKQLQHPNVLSLLDAGEADGLPYYVMPWVDGESLRHRLKRERQLPLDETVRITRDIAAALEAAHRANIVHRDVKPENVLLTGDQVFLADFGIARALSQAAGERLTDSGLAIGTPGYMSPEQASGERDVDTRSDVYSLGCVVFEMLAGEAPYTGPSAHAVVAKQLSLPVPSVRVVRNSVPTMVDDVIGRALAKVPADRYQNAGAFARALEEASSVTATPLTRLAWRVARHPVRAAAAVVGVIALLIATRATVGRTWAGRGSLVASDTLRYAVLPFGRQGISAGLATDDAQAVRTALLGWTDISVVDASQVADVVGDRRSGRLTRGVASDIARALRSGRYIRGELSGMDNQRELHLRLFDALRGDSLLAEATARLVGASRPDSIFALLVDSLVLRDALRDQRGGRPTRSLLARQAFGRGQAAFEAWDLARADSEFGAAVRADAAYAQANLWLALARLWAGADATRYGIAAEQAVLGAVHLSDRERGMASAVQATARGALDTACPLWESLVRRDSLDAVAWYGAAHCLTSDDVVIPDRASPSGWRFRTSYSEALRDYERAFRLHPAMLASFGSGAFEALGRLFKTGTSLLRQGRAMPPSEQRFASSMEWISDSLAFIPYKWGGGHAVHQFPSLAATSEAVRHQRALVRDVAATWVAAFPRNAYAWEALAKSLAALGDRSALDTLTRARRLALTDRERTRTAAVDVAMRMSFAVRDADTSALRRARSLADSLLVDSTSRNADPVLATSLAALTGRADAAALYARAAEVAEAFAIPDALRDGTASLLVRSSLGGPSDSLRALERHVSDLIDRAVTPTERLNRRLEFLARAASMAFPQYQFETLAALANDGDPLVVLEWQLLERDSSAVRLGLTALKEARRHALPEHLAIDALTPEATLLASLGDARSVVQWLEPTLRSLPQVQPDLLSSPVRAGSLPWAILRLARAKAELGDRDAARRWASAVAILWSDADPFLRTAVEEATRLAR